MFVTLIRWLLSGALVAAAASMLVVDGIRWTRTEMNLSAFLACMYGPAVDLRWGKPVIACETIPRTEGLKICTATYYPPECNAFDWDGDGDVDLADFGAAANGDD